jgi:hypothetical protein
MSVYRAPMAPTEAVAPVVLPTVSRRVAVTSSALLAGATVACGLLAGAVSPVPFLCAGMLPLLGFIGSVVLAIRPASLRLDVHGVSGNHVVRVGERRASRQRWSVAWSDLRAVHVDVLDTCLVLHTRHDQLQVSLARGAHRAQTAIIDYHDRLLREPRRRALEIDALRRQLVQIPVRFQRQDAGSPRVVEVRPEGVALGLRLYPWEQVSSAHKIFVGDATGMVRVILRDGRALDVAGRFDSPLDELAELIDPPFDKVEVVRRLVGGGMDLREAAARAGLPAA